jgi:hypothetical protein
MSSRTCPGNNRNNKHLEAIKTELGQKLASRGVTVKRITGSRHRYDIYRGDEIIEHDITAGSGSKLNILRYAIERYAKD